MFRTIIVPTKDKLTIPIPVEYIGKQVEVLAFPIDETENDHKSKYSWEKAKKFYAKHCIDMNSYKFNRDEANER